MRNLFIILWFLFSYVALGQGQIVTLRNNVTVTSGSDLILLYKGATVHVLSMSRDKAVVDYRRKDGSLMITQIPVTALDSVSQSVISKPPSFLSNSSGVEVPVSLRANSLTPSLLPLTSPAGIISVKTTPLLMPTLAGSPTISLQQALILAGSNRNELQKFLDCNQSPEGKLLIQKARQSDLVNLTAQLLSDDLATVQKAKTNSKWADRIPPDIWQEYVLPYRVADEPLDDFKPDFYDKLAPIISSAQESGTAALLVHDWYYHQNNGGPWVGFKVSESRDQPPRILLNQTRIGRCFEMNLLCVALLRSVGIPARIAGTSYWMNDEYYHYWVEYYDTQTSSWLYFEGANPDPASMMAKSFLRTSGSNMVFATVYALPGFCPVSDPIGKEMWQSLVNTTSLYLPTGTVHFTVSLGPGQARPIFTVYSWNLSAWRSVAQTAGDDQGQGDITVASNTDNYPYLVSISTGGKLLWQTITVDANNATDVRDLLMDQTPSEQVISLVRPSKLPQQAVIREE
jgi:hypothetical protein